MFRRTTVSNINQTFISFFFFYLKRTSTSKNKRSSKPNLQSEHNNLNVVYDGDIVVLCCNIQKPEDGKRKKKSAKKEKANYATMRISKKGRCKWRFDQNPQKFKIMKISTDQNQQENSVLHIVRFKNWKIMKNVVKLCSLY